MAGQPGSKRNRKARAAKARRRGRVVGLGSSAGAFLALGLGPLAGAPPARADFGFDELLDVLDPSLVAGGGRPRV
jgi:hypothetical protein